MTSFLDIPGSSVALHQLMIKVSAKSNDGNQYNLEVFNDYSRGLTDMVANHKTNVFKNCLVLIMNRFTTKTRELNSYKIVSIRQEWNCTA